MVKVVKPGSSGRARLRRPIAGLAALATAALFLIPGCSGTDVLATPRIPVSSTTAPTPWVPVEGQVATCVQLGLSTAGCDALVAIGRPDLRDMGIDDRTVTGIELHAPTTAPPYTLSVPRTYAFIEFALVDGRRIQTAIWCGTGVKPGDALCDTPAPS